jgi:transcription antitermination factor NusG
MTDTLSGPRGGPAGVPPEISWKEELSLSNGERWFAVNTLSRRELGAKLQLERQRFRAYCPYLLRTVRHARKLRTVRAPVFPGYIFVILDLSRDPWRAVNGTFGVARLVMGGDRPLPVPTGIVESLLAMTDGACLLKCGQDLQTNQAVRVAVGPLAGVLGRLDRFDDNGRVRVLLDIMGGKVPAVLDRDLLEAV